MTASYDVTTNIGKVRLLINDIDVSHPFYTDDEIQAFIDLYSQTSRLAAAQAWSPRRRLTAPMSMRRRSGISSN